MRRHLPAFALVAVLSGPLAAPDASAQPADPIEEVAADTAPAADPAPSSPAAAPAADPAAPAPAAEATLDEGPEPAALPAPVDIGADPAGFAAMTYQLIVGGHWVAFAIALTMAIVYSVRRWPGALEVLGLGTAADWFATRVGGVVLAAVTSFGGAALHAALAGEGTPGAAGWKAAFAAFLAGLAALLPNKPKEG